MTLYSANNTPYSALTGVMTGDVNERTSLSSYRFVSAMIAQLIVGGFTLPLVAKFGHGEQRQGLADDHGRCGRSSASCCSSSRSSPRRNASSRTRKQKIRRQAGLRQPARRTARGSRCSSSRWPTSSMLAMRGGTLFYYFQYYVDQDSLFDLLQALGLTNASQAADCGTTC